MNLRKLHCRRCNHNWIPRIDKVTICPKCKSPYWSKPKVRFAKDEIPVLKDMSEE